MRRMDKRQHRHFFLSALLVELSLSCGCIEIQIYCDSPGRAGLTTGLTRAQAAVTVPQSERPGLCGIPSHSEGRGVRGPRPAGPGRVPQRHPQAGPGQPRAAVSQPGTGR